MALPSAQDPSRREMEEATPPAPGFVFDYLAYLLAAASHGMSAEFHAVIRAQGLRVPEWRVLACLASRDGLMVSELARITLYDQPRLTKTLNHMEGAGLVVRRDDEEDRRRVMIHLTEEGRTRIAPLLAAAREHEERFTRKLSPRERASLKFLLKLLVER
ncbi:MAG TPA: MarR family winged helix-turn-helix transcriptional regulator [Arenibaculum sp.]|nr:MarR family winged helix-turn-helix transcriptional regulator [Arenibaculum sp.]